MWHRWSTWAGGSGSVPVGAHEAGNRSALPAVVNMSLAVGQRLDDRAHGRSSVTHPLTAVVPLSLVPCQHQPPYATAGPNRGGTVPRYDILRSAHAQPFGRVRSAEVDVPWGGVRDVLTQLADSGRGFDGHEDVQETTFALDAFSRFVCNTIDEVADAQRQGGFEFDVIVIGSGMYGAFTAAKIYERARRRPLERRPRVLVLEAGPFLISEHFQNLTRIGPFFELVNRPAVDENQSFLSQIDYTGGPLQGIVRHHRCVGGKSLFWGGWAPPLMNDDQQDDLAQWPGEVRDFLLSPEGYDEVARQIGTDVTTDYIHGPLMDHLLSVAQRVVGDGAVPRLTRVVEAPIAVHAEGFESGLLSMGKFSSLPLLLDSIREDAESSGGPTPTASSSWCPTQRFCASTPQKAARRRWCWPFANRRGM